MKLNLPPKLQRKLVWFPVTLFCKIFIPSSAFYALLCSGSQSLCFVKFSVPVLPLMLYYAETTVLAPLVTGLYG
jgi:hypothetical protein